MSTVKKGITVPDHEWRQHLRPFSKRRFWKKQRKAHQREQDREIKNGKEAT